MSSTSAACQPLPAVELRQRIGNRLRRQWHESNGERQRAKSRRRKSLVEVCSVRVGKSLFGVPITHILEIVGSARPQPVPLAPGYVGGLVHYRGDVLTTVSLRQLLALPPKDGAQDILVLESEGGCFGLLVDSVCEVLTVSAIRLRTQSFDSQRASPGPAGRGIQAQRPSAGDARPGARSIHFGLIWRHRARVIRPE